MEAKKIVDEELLRPDPAKSVINDMYVEATKDDANIEVLSKLVQDSDSPYLQRDILTDVSADARVQGLYESLVRTVYNRNGQDLEAAQVTAFGSLQNIISVSNVNGTAQTFTPAPEAVYGLSAEQVQDAIIKDMQPILEGSAFAGDVQLQLASDPLSLRTNSWPIMFRDSETGMWRPVTDEDGVAQRWEYTPPTAAEQVQTGKDLKEQLREWESEFKRLPPSKQMKFGDTDPVGNYIRVQQEREAEPARQIRESYFGGN